MKRKVVILIPARMDSKRFPGKPLYKVGRFPLTCWTYVQAKMTGYRPFVITPDNEIIRDLIQRQIPCLLTSDKPINGTERCAEIAECLDLAETDIIINIQGDLLKFDFRSVRPMVHLLSKGNVEYVTGFSKLDSEAAADPNKVKCCLKTYPQSMSMIVPDFSREPIPGTRNFLHVGIYAFTKKSLKKYARLSPTTNEKTRKLEQMRVIDNGMKIGGILMEAPISIDCIEDAQLINDEMRILHFSQKGINNGSYKA
jgi:3-deoxy-manno-octulosonate cytidylyltransferase (CMP-KDO synthetase)